jgi:hypothetical protein
MIQWTALGTCFIFVICFLAYCTYYAVRENDPDDRWVGLWFVFVMLFILYGLAGAFGIPI